MAAVYLQALDLVVGQVGLVIDLLEVNVGVGIGLGHDEGVLSEEESVNEEVIVNNGRAACN